MDMERLKYYKAIGLSMLASTYCAIPLAYWIFHNKGKIKTIVKHVLFAVLSGFIAMFVAGQMGITN